MAIDDTVGYVHRLDAWYTDKLSQKYTAPVAKDVIRSILRHLSEDETFLDLLIGGNRGIDELIQPYKVNEFIEGNRTMFSDVYEVVEGVIAEKRKQASQGRALKGKMKSLIGALKKKGAPNESSDKDIDVAFVSAFGSYEGLNDVVDFMLAVTYDTDFAEPIKESPKNLPSGMTVEDVLTYVVTLTNITARQPFRYIYERVLADLTE